MMDFSSSSQLVQLQDFLLRANKYNCLTMTSDGGALDRKVILVEVNQVITHHCHWHNMGRVHLSGQPEPKGDCIDLKLLCLWIHTCINPTCCLLRIFQTNSTDSQGACMKS